MSRIHPRQEVDCEVYLLMLQVCLVAGILVWKLTRAMQNISISIVRQSSRPNSAITDSHQEPVLSIGVPSIIDRWICTYQYYVGGPRVIDRHYRQVTLPKSDQDPETSLMFER